jgi:hypothetical protein
MYRILFPVSNCQIFLVWPMYTLLHVLQVILYMPLLSCSCAVFWDLGLIICCNVFVLLKAIFMSVCLKSLVIILTLGLW